jgi:hypothetical protein
MRQLRTRRVKGFSKEWEAMKALRRDVNHHDAVQESAMITRRQWELMGRMSEAEIDLNSIIRALNAKKIPFVLTGAHGIGGWTGRPRATHDIDILVKAGRNHARAVKAMRALYPDLDVHEQYGVTAFFVPGKKESVIDVTYPHRADIEETLADPVDVTDRGLRYRVPNLEAALSNKYGAMLSLSRDVAKRVQDTVDFMLMVKHSMDEGQQPINLDKLRELGEKVWPGGGGAEILSLVEDVKAGGIVDLNALMRLPRGEQRRE